MRRVSQPTFGGDDATARDGIGPDEAFDRLVAASQHTDLELVEVARWLVEDAARA